MDIAAKIVERADFLLPLKRNQFTLAAEVESCFETAPKERLVTKTTVEKRLGRIETRLYTASNEVEWINADKYYPDQPRFKTIKTLVHVLSRTVPRDNQDENGATIWMRMPPWGVS